MEILKVSSKSAPNSVAGAIAGVIRESGSAELQAVGAGAANQAIKAVAIARGYLAPSGIDLVCVPAFVSVEIDGEERTAMRLIVEPIYQSAPAFPETAGALLLFTHRAQLKFSFRGGWTNARRHAILTCANGSGAQCLTADPGLCPGKGGYFSWRRNSRRRRG